MLTAPCDVDVLVIGAGPTGLTLAAQLARFGVRFRIIDKQVDRAQESRALGVQARTLEILQTLDLGEALVRRGSDTTQLRLHVDRGETVNVDLGHVPRSDTRFPFILFVGQPQTEAVLADYLARSVTIERGVELTTARQQDGEVVCTLRHVDGRQERVSTRFVAGCDGAHSLVRRIAGIDFEGAAYPQNFVLGDVEADNLERAAIHAFGSGRGLAMFFPLGHPTTWRVMAMESGEPPHRTSEDHDVVTTRSLSLAELQSMVDEPTFGSVRLRDAAWLTRFRLHHRQASRYREGSMFLAGDAAHIHSPVGAQGMNTGIQDAWNLGWKLALVCQGRADPRLLDSYQAERWPVGRTLLRATDRLFGTFAQSVSGSTFFMTLRRLVVRGVVAPALSNTRFRAFAFHFVSQLGIRYRKSPAVMEGEPRLRGGPQAGDRLPDARVRRGEDIRWLQQELSGPRLHLLLCGPVGRWERVQLTELRGSFPGLLELHHLSQDNSAGVLVDEDGAVLRRLGVEDAGQYLIRPDGHVAFRCGGTDLNSAAAFLRRWFIVRPS